MRSTAASSAEEAIETTARIEKKSLWLVYLFFAALIVPWIINVGSVRLSVYRLVLIAAFLPATIMWLQGQAGKIRTADIALLAYSAWVVLSLVSVEGLQSGLQSSGITVIETLSPYLIARCYIRSADDFYRMAQFLFRLFAIFLLPFALVETLTLHNVLLEIFTRLHQSIPDSFYDPRWGFRRVQSFTEHPILFGVCAGSIFSMTYLVLGYGRSTTTRLFKSGLALLTVFSSLSAGPMGAVVAQALLIAWDRLLKGNPLRWKILLISFLVFNMGITAIPNQSPIGFYISHFTFDASSAYYRVLIWRFGSASALNHPLFGVGMGEWERPSWMPSSIDMFWLIHAVRYGIPAALMMLLAFFSAYLSVSSKKGLSQKLSEYRLAYLLCMTGYFIAGWAVHFWNATYVLFVFLLGSGIWLLDVQPGTGPSSVRKSRRGQPRTNLKAANPVLTATEKRTGNASRPNASDVNSNLHPVL